MDTTKIRTVFFVVAIFLCLVAAPVKADWDESDSYKMHYPQLPDPDGYDVTNYNGTSGEPLPLADDWLCTETGRVTDIHIWGSWQNDSKGEIESFNVSIWSDDPGTNFSHPDELLWQHTFFKSEFNERYWGNGSQGWMSFSSYPDRSIVTVDHNHNDTWQYNLHIDPAMAFKQEEGTTYWLALSRQVNSSEYEFGWKTSLNEWRDRYVAYTPYEYPSPAREGMWLAFLGNESLSFVIDGSSQAPKVPALTPIGLIALVSLLSAIAAVAIVRKRR
jgi:hypothetical protein